MAEKDPSHSLEADTSTLQVVLEKSPVGMSLTDLEGRFRYLNPALCRMVGYRKEELLGRSFREITHPEDIDVNLKHLRDLVAGDIQEYHFEKRYLHKEGQVVWVRLHGSVLRDDQGTPEQLLGQTVDITPLKTLQSEQNALLKKLTTILETTGQFVFDFDPATDQISWDHETIFGHPRSALDRGQKWFDHLHPADAARAGASFADHVQHSEPCQQDYRLLDSTGRPIWIRSRAIPLLDDSGTPLRYVGVVESIHERRVAAERLRQDKEELERSNAELEQFAYIASHDLQEPLRTVTNYVALLAEDYRDLLDEEGREYIQFSIDATLRMRQLINDLLAYSRVVGSEAEPTSLRTADIVEHLLRSMQAALTEKKAKIVVKDLPETIISNESRLTQLLQNLLSNALKFVGAQDPLVEISCTELPESYEFRVKDNGIGIPPAQQDKIFQIFQRLHSRDAYPGTGIGLALCEKIARSLGGKIGVRSEPGQGSTFWFTLPKSPSFRSV
ncbi:MAG: PAS domain S-box protein [Verrucomicrobiota bacterium]